MPQFKRWYSQAGTPRVTLTSQYDAHAQTCTLNFTQSCPATPGQDNKLPFVIPISLGLVGSDGTVLPLQLQDSLANAADNHLFVMTQASESITLHGLTQEPVPSVLRGFSAPVLLEAEFTDRQLLTLLAHDPDHSTAGRPVSDCCCAALSRR